MKIKKRKRTIKKVTVNSKTKTETRLMDSGRMEVKREIARVNRKILRKVRGNASYGNSEIPG